MLMPNLESGNKMLNRKTTNILIILALVLILTGSMIYYFNYRMDLLSKEYNGMILDLARQMKSQLEFTQKNLETQIGTLGSFRSRETPPSRFPFGCPDVARTPRVRSTQQVLRG